MKKVLLSLLGFLIFLLPQSVKAASPYGDINLDGVVNIQDYTLLSNVFGTTDTDADVNSDGIVNIQDYVVLSNNFGNIVPTPTPIATSTSGPVVESSDWTQDAHDAQRTGYTNIDPLTPWSLVWTWNGPDSSGGAGGHTYNAPKEARTVAGGSAIYVPAGSSGIWALNKSNGSQLWHSTLTSFNAAPAYDPTTQTVIAGGSNGTLYKFSASSGSVLQTYNAGSGINKAILIVGNYAYAVSDDGRLHKVKISDMSSVWVYSAGSAVSTPATYSSSRQIVIYATSDLYVHAVNDSGGTVKWKVKPSPNTAGFPNQFDNGWPVIAEVHGVVFLRMRLSHDALTSFGIFPNTNSEIRSLLVENPNRQNLFALDLDTGEKQFIPAVGFGSVEDMIDGSPYGDISAFPVVRQLSDGSEVVYIQWRNGQSEPPDYRWDSHLGEMVLDNSTISGLEAGDLRFVKMSRYDGYGGNSYVFISDEQCPLSMAGNSIFHNHWGALEGVRITDRSSSKGLTYSDPIDTSNLPAVVRGMQSCSDQDNSTHWTTCGLTLFNDGRYWSGPGFWEYWNIVDPAGAPQSAGFRPLYTYVTGGLVVMEGNGGDLYVFSHSGSY